VRIVSFHCQNCDEPHDGTDHYCCVCGSRLDKTPKTCVCAECGAELVYTGRDPNYCGSCGGSFAASGVTNSTESKSVPQSRQ
jgi:predicted amidophosphoribosyltransferase